MAFPSENAPLEFACKLFLFQRGLMILIPCRILSPQSSCEEEKKKNYKN